MSRLDGTGEDYIRLGPPGATRRVANEKLARLNHLFQRRLIEFETRAHRRAKGHCLHKRALYPLGLGPDDSRINTRKVLENLVILEANGPDPRMDIRATVKAQLGPALLGTLDRALNVIRLNNGPRTRVRHKPFPAQIAA